MFENCERSFCDPNCEAIEEYDEAGDPIVRFVTRCGEELIIDYCDRRSGSALIRR